VRARELHASSREDRAEPLQLGNDLSRIVLARLVRLYQTTGRPDQASEWKTRLTEFDKTEADKKDAATPSEAPK